MVKHSSRVHWARLVLIVVGFIILSFAFAYLMQRFVGQLDPTKYQLDYLAYTIVFFATLVSNLTIIAPVPFALSIMIAMAANGNPALIATISAAGGAIGELSGYYAGYLGKKIAIPDAVLGPLGHGSIEGWISRYGVWAIAFLAFQPVLPFDIGGMVAGAARMPLHKFLPALFIGKVLKYLILVYAGAGVIHSIPFFAVP